MSNQYQPYPNIYSNNSYPVIVPNAQFFSRIDWFSNSGNYTAMQANTQSWCTAGSLVQVQIVTQAINITNTSNIISVLSAASLYQGMIVNATGLPGNVTIVSISGTNVTISQAATASGNTQANFYQYYYKVALPGYYLCNLGLFGKTQAIGPLNINPGLFLNGNLSATTSVMNDGSTGTGYRAGAAMSTIVACNVNDLLDFRADATTGYALDTRPGAPTSNWVTYTWVGPL